MSILADALGDGSIGIKESAGQKSGNFFIAGGLIASQSALSGYIDSMFEAVEKFRSHISIAAGTFDRAR